MTSLADILTSIFRPVPCDFCPSVGPTYRDPETGCFYCLPCLEMATDPALALEDLSLEDGPEDPETVAIGRAVLDDVFAELFPLSVPRAETLAEEIQAERRDMALIACHSRQIAA